MSLAYCTKCDRYFRWNGRRGARIADMRSPCCGAPARGKPREWAVKARVLKRWQVVDLRSQHKAGRAYIWIEDGMMMDVHCDNWEVTETLVHGWRLVSRTWRWTGGQEETDFEWVAEADLQRAVLAVPDGVK